MTVQLVHCADLHLDKNFSISDPERAAARKEDLNRNFVAAVDYAIANHPDLFLMAGDIFDRVRPSNDAIVLVMRKIRELKESGIATFIIAGNHDTPKIGNYKHIALDALSTAGLATVFSRFDIIQKRELEVDGSKVCVSGKSFNVQNDAANPLREHKVPLDGDHNILLLHASLVGLSVNPTIPEMAAQSPFYPDDVVRGLDYLALGHYHNFYQREHAGVEICNPGAIERLTWAEAEEEKGFVWVDLSRQEVEVEFVRLDTRPMKQFDLILQPTSRQSLLDQVLSFLDEVASPEAIARLRFHGSATIEQYQKMQLSEVSRYARSRFFDLSVDRRELALEGYGRVFLGRVDNPIQAFTNRLDSRIGAAQSEVERGFLLQVRDVGVRYLSEAA
jgi:DNA repair exonuclease SbcCD nuclease subunit